MLKNSPGIPELFVNEIGLVNGVGSLPVDPMTGMFAASRIG